MTKSNTREEPVSQPVQPEGKIVTFTDGSTAFDGRVWTEGKGWEYVGLERKIAMYAGSYSHCPKCGQQVINGQFLCGHIPSDSMKAPEPTAPTGDDIAMLRKHGKSSRFEPEAERR